MKKKIIFYGILLVIVVGVAVWYKFGAKIEQILSGKIENVILQKKLRQRTPKTPLKIGFTTDVHAYSSHRCLSGKEEIMKRNNKYKKEGKQYSENIKEESGDNNNKGLYLNWRIEDALKRFVSKMNEEFKPDFVVDGGDLIDGKDHHAEQDWKLVNQELSNLMIPHYYVLGNHDTRTLTKEKWLKLTGYRKPYYYFDIKGYRVFILDGNYLSNGQDTTPTKRSYPGRLSDEEWKWLDEKLKEAVFGDKDPIIFIHQPPVVVDYALNWELFPSGKRFHNLCRKYGVRVVFSGHIERMCDIKDGPTEYFVMQGFWKANKRLYPQYQFKNGSNFYYITITTDNVTVKSEYRKATMIDGRKTKEKELFGCWEGLVINSKDYNCQDGLKLIKDKAGVGFDEDGSD